MRFVSPGWLALLAVVPVLAYLHLRRGPPMPRGRRRAFTALRAAALTLAALALAAPEVGVRSDRLQLVLLLDSSDSVDEAARARALAVFAGLRARLRPDDLASIVRFGADAAVDPAPEPDPASGSGIVDATATDIGGAIQFALAQGGGTARRFLLASDGVENRGAAVSAAAVARAAGVEIDALPLVPSPGGEVLIEDVQVPEPMRAGEPREATVILRSRATTQARLVFLRDGEPLGSRQLVLEPGESAVRLEVSFPDPGLHSCEAVVQALDDRQVENNRYERLVEVAGSPSVLYVSEPGHAASALLAALAAQGISVAARGPAELPATLAGFLPYDAVILDDVSAFRFSYEKLETLEQYVRDVGGGLLMIGGPRSFGAGGWYQTPVERALPVDMDVTSVAQTPRLALVVVTDKSGSMGGSVASGETKLDLVKSAALQSLEILNPFDRVGLLAFDADREWTVPLTEASNRDAVASELAMLEPGGGTIMWPALDDARRALEASDAAVKHVIVLSDGLTNPGEFESLVTAMHREKITVSAVAVGGDADRELLSKIASWGGGRFYATDDARDIPRIFVTETLLASRGLLVEERFLPVAPPGHELLRGIAPSELPALGGYVLTYPKSGAERVLGAPREAPLLATWRYGLGRSAAFTSDLAGRWSRGWLQWAGFPRFAAQLVRWIEAPRPSTVLDPRLALGSGRGAISVDAFDALGFADGLTLSAVVLDPGRGRLSVPLAQTGPGRYEGSFPAPRAGDYVVTIAARPARRAGEASEAEAPMIRTIGASLPYPEEYRDLGVNRRLLERIASDTGGAVVDPQAPATLDRMLRRAPSAATAGRPLWPILIALSLACFFLDVVVRRFVLPEELRRRLAELLARRGQAMEQWSYEELTDMVNRAREDQRRRLRERIAGLAVEGRVAPDLAAYLYLARLKGKQGQPTEDAGKPGRP